MDMIWCYERQTRGVWSDSEKTVREGNFKIKINNNNKFFMFVFYYNYFGGYFICHHQNMWVYGAHVSLVKKEDLLIHHNIDLLLISINHFLILYYSSFVMQTVYINCFQLLKTRSSTVISSSTKLGNLGQITYMMLLKFK